ncbi:Clp amino terminal domain-containing protein, pathogenicity island component [Micromonospora phaseoli]|uniref:Clp amino terminal domain-containing protein, pathogenicity island component n=2 Tax=Micromonospora phaseoli TaxID=1144548 RepID=A0A1H6ZUS4_9ACTN|nr:ClpA/ClpB-like protein [Micromonospora phaseoli]SEJ57219.1 Clp amino terminal domain-containing protein, pathogenicity island component [Micromonospora phaseoli]
MTIGDTEPVDVGEEFADVLRAAYYYALVDGGRVVGPGQLLVAAARNDERAGRVLGRTVAQARATVSRGEGPDTGDGAGPVPSGYAGMLREARWWVLRAQRDAVPADPPLWSTAVGPALTRSARTARSAGVTRLDVPHLVLGLLDPADPSVAELARRTGLDVAAARRRIAAGDLAAEPAPFAPLVDPLRVAGAVRSRSPWLVRWLPALFARLTGRQARWGGPVLACLEREVMRQAVLVGHDVVQTSAVLLAIVSLDAQLAATGQRLVTAYQPHNQGGKALTDVGFQLGPARSVAESWTGEREALPVADSSARFWGTGKPGDPRWGVAATRVMDRATDLAREHGHADAGTSHLLAAVLAEDGAAGHLLAALGLDREELRRRVTHQLTSG